MAKSDNGSKLLSYLDKLQTAIVVVALSGMIVVVGLQVFFRFVVKGSLPWSEELARYLMVWTVFIGASLGAKEGAHIGVEAFVRLLPKSMYKAACVLAGIISIVFCIVVTFLSLKVVNNIYLSGQLSPAMEIPIYWAYLAIPVGMILMAISFLQAVVEKISAREENV